MSHDRSREIHLVEQPRIPLDGLILGWGAMIPFAVIAAAVWLGPPDWRDGLRLAAQIWGVALMLFLSGVRRGLSFRTPGGPGRAQWAAFALLFWGGFGTMFLPVDWGLAVIAVAFALLSVEDTRAARAGAAPLYFARLRPGQMAFAAVAVAAVWFG